jgi:hypothetical protein
MGGNEFVMHAVVAAVKNAERPHTEFQRNIAIRIADEMDGLTPSGTTEEYIYDTLVGRVHTPRFTAKIGGK